MKESGVERAEGMTKTYCSAPKVFVAAWSCLWLLWSTEGGSIHTADIQESLLYHQ